MTNTPETTPETLDAIVKEFEENNYVPAPYVGGKGNVEAQTQTSPA